MKRFWLWLGFKDIEDTKLVAGLRFDIERRDNELKEARYLVADLIAQVKTLDGCLAATRNRADIAEARVVSLKRGL